MGKKRPQDVRSAHVKKVFETLSRLRIRSETGKTRTRLYTQLLMMALQYPGAFPRNTIEKLGEFLISLRNDDDTEFVEEHFSWLEKVVRVAESEHAMQHAEEITMPKDMPTKK